jgi:hypothetical protein
MRTIKMINAFSILLTVFACSVLFMGSTNTLCAEDDLSKILGREGQTKEGTLVFQFPRSDVKVSINNEPVPTALGFTSWTAFKNMGASTLVMGDLVLLEPEVNRVISALERSNIKVTALHNHFFYDKPKIMFMHIHGTGKDVDLAKGIRSALEKTGTPITTQMKPQVGELNMDTGRIEKIIGQPGQASGGVYKTTVGRQGVKMGDMEITSAMGANSWAGFMGTDQKAHVAGDMIMTAPEVNQVINILRKGNIEVVAVHNHMLDEQPRIFFLHYWGTGTTAHLAETIRQVFDIVKNPAK